MKNLHNSFPDCRQQLLTAALIIFAVAFSANAADTPPGVDDSVTASEPSQSGTVNPDASAESMPDYTKLRRTVREHQNTIMEMEKKGGTNNVRLSENLIDLGRTYRKLGRNDKAIEAFNRALQITRVNLGPETPRQLPILELMIDTNKAAADWEALEDNYEFFYWINRRLYADDDARLLQVIYRLARWHLQAYLTAFDPIPYKHLLESEKLYHDAIDIIEKNSGSGDPRLLRALNGIAAANYHITSHIYNSNSMAAMTEIQGSAATMSRVENVSSMLVWRPVSYGEYERKKVFHRIADIYSNHSDLPATDRAAALVNIGDWYFIYGWRSTALENYNRAYQLLTESKSGRAAFDRLFGTPVRIPTLTGNYPPGQTKAEDEHPFVKVSFDVTRDGCAKRIKFIEQSDPEKFMYRKRARDYLHASLFRPGIAGGKTVRTRNLVLTLSGKLLKTGTDRRLVNYDRFDVLISVKRCGNAPR